MSGEGEGENGAIRRDAKGARYDPTNIARRLDLPLSGSRAMARGSE